MAGSPAVERGVYDLTESGRGALLRWPQPRTLVVSERPTQRDISSEIRLRGWGIESEVATRRRREFRKREKIMTSTLPSTGLELRSTITSAGELELSLVNAPMPTPKARRSRRAHRGGADQSERPRPPPRTRRPLHRRRVRPRRAAAGESANSARPDEGDGEPDRAIHARWQRGRRRRRRGRRLLRRRRR